ncbi:N-acetylgalactosamine kinase [Daktulosphaira vitifoliae]|uniref:N-acetylgalactosamine kinase n=1 Tax=Daktulosphaira vitifoliae TaxID=58002 RepID=UPI0021AA7BDE|nr:N-acetylgalactosamine kinase [Daktulosphaira vitifoliae]XP_050539156.1 N-acetylgalactosamine kinase [Daktulosphaira vitifoliae]
MSAGDIWQESNKDDSILKLEHHFSQTFQKGKPEYYVKVPGRVNLIGEHVDYCGYSVFPMAIKQCIIVAAKRLSGHNIVRITNTDTQSYEDVSQTISDIDAVTIGKSQSWTNYFFCGIKGAQEYMTEKQLKTVENVGFLFAVSGNIPESAGLSSSSALVTAALISTLAGYGVSVPRHQLAEISAKCERYIGTAGGGMDQAIAIHAKKGFASRINFNPLTIQQFRLPDDVTFIVAQSLAIKNKAASNDFNTRVVECRLASQIIAKSQNIDWKNLTVLSQLQKTLKYSLDEMIKLVHQHLHKSKFTKNEICEILSVTEDELNVISLTPNTTNVLEFYLHQRALHVFKEAKRMEKFCEECENSCSPIELGELMNLSHTSLRDLYDCSQSDLEELIELCKQGGAYGCKLTGAGWGGCVVIMVPSNIKEKFIQFLKDKFYSKRSVDKNKLTKVIFATKPSDGAFIFKSPGVEIDKLYELPPLKIL